jgi:hypothetical protein
MPVSKTTPGRLGARAIAPIRVAFRHRNDVGSQNEGTFKGITDGLGPKAASMIVGVPIEPRLYGLKDGFVLPS